MTTDQPILGPLLMRLRGIKDRKEEQAAVVKAINAEEAECEAAIMAGLRNSGQDKATVIGVGTASIGKKWRALYEPEKWPDLLKWFVESGNGHIVQRRMTDAKVMELVDNGTELPDGLKVESFSDLSFRRA